MSYPLLNSLLNQFTRPTRNFKSLTALTLGCLILGATNSSANEHTEASFKPLFNGKNYDGWYIKLKDGDQALGERVFAIVDNMIHVFGDSWPDEIDLDKGTDATIGMLYTKKTFDKYHLKFEYKWGTRKANYFAKWQYDAGVYYHITDDKVFPTGVEYQIHYDHTKSRNGTGDLIRPGGQKYDWYFNIETNEYLHPNDGGVLYTGQQSYTGKKWLHKIKQTDKFNALNNQWNSCELIVMGGEYAIHKLNGEVVNMAFNLTPAAGIIGFQSETAEIFYRNIEIQEFEESIPAESFLQTPSIDHSKENDPSLEPTVDGTGTIDLLEGNTLDAWKLPNAVANWRLEEGSIVGETGNQKLTKPEWIYTNERFDDFEFSCELRLTGDKRRNTGIYYRVTTFPFKSKRGNKSYEAPSGYEFDAAYQEPNKKKNIRGSLGDWYARPSLRIFADSDIINKVYKEEDWNRMTIRAKGNRLEYWINGEKVIDYVDNDPKASSEGIIGLQIHDGSVMKVECRNIRIRPLN